MTEGKGTVSHACHSSRALTGFRKHSCPSIASPMAFRSNVIDNSFKTLQKPMHGLTHNREEKQTLKVNAYNHAIGSHLEPLEKVCNICLGCTERKAPKPNDIASFPGRSTTENGVVRRGGSRYASEIPAKRNLLAHNSQTNVNSVVVHVDCLSNPRICLFSA